MENVVIRRANSADSASGLIAFFIMSMPTNSMPNPATIWPIRWSFRRFTNIIIATPTSSISGMNVIAWKPATIHAVTVVPMFAPKITPVACIRSSKPAFTKPTTMTVVADEDCIIIVNTTPTSNPIIGLRVSDSSSRLSLSPAAFSRPSPIIFMPYRNSARPPSSDIVMVSDIIFSFLRAARTRVSLHIALFLLPVSYKPILLNDGRRCQPQP